MNDAEENAMMSAFADIASKGWSTLQWPDFEAGWQAALKWCDSQDAQINQQLVEALELADAMLSGANMNANVVHKKVKAALAAAKETK